MHGLTRETVIALLANLTSLHMRRHEYRDRGMTLEHPRSGTNDDVESYPKILNEFCKRINPALPFYYWTGKKTRFTEAALPSFNQPSSNGVERLHRVKVSRRADPGVFVADRASLPQRGLKSVRAQFHKIPQALPAPPNN